VLQSANIEGRIRGGIFWNDAACTGKQSKASPNAQAEARSKQRGRREVISDDDPRSAGRFLFDASIFPLGMQPV
jgi:hypothetical protein